MTSSRIGLWLVDFTTTTGSTHTIAVQAHDDDEALSLAYDRWTSEPIHHFTRATLVGEW